MLKTTTVMAIAVMFLGALGLVRLESEPVRDAAQQARPAKAQQVALAQRHCGNVCFLSDVPIYVPPNRGSTPARIGGGVRGGSLKL